MPGYARVLLLEPLFVVLPVLRSHITTTSYGIDGMTTAKLCEAMRSSSTEGAGHSQPCFLRGRGASRASEAAVFELFLVGAEFI